MPTGIFIPANETRPLEIRSYKYLPDYQRDVDGFIEVLDLEDANAILLINEEGKPRHLQVNERATLLLWMHCRPFFLRDDIRGDSILLGSVREGHFSDVPPLLKSLLTETKAVAIEYQNERDGDAWIPVDRSKPYASWAEAYSYALMWSKLTGVSAVRVSIH